MSKSILSSLVSQWFQEYIRLAYWVARRWVRRLLDRYARDCSPDELEELAQDAIAVVSIVSPSAAPSRFAGNRTAKNGFVNALSVVRGMPSALSPVSVRFPMAL